MSETPAVGGLGGSWGIELEAFGRFDLSPDAEVVAPDPYLSLYRGHALLVRIWPMAPQVAHFLVVDLPLPTPLLLFFLSPGAGMLVSLGGSRPAFIALRTIRLSLFR